jgi:Protein of unknown function (DUF3995)
MGSPAGPARIEVTAPRALAVPAYGAAALAIAYALVSAYWTAGGTALLSTVGGGLERLGREGGAAGVVLGAVTVVLKLAGGLLALALVRPWRARLPPRLVEGAALLAGGVLTLYGAGQVAVGALALMGVFGTPDDPRALRWHVLLWDPWFLVWGLLLVLAALVHRRLRPPAGGRG